MLTPPDNVLRRDAVQSLTGLGRSTIYAKMTDGNFPKPIKLGPRSVGWLQSEIVAWMEARKAERDVA